MGFCRICFIVYMLCTYIAGTERYYHSQWIIVLKILICVYSWLLWSSGPCLATTGAERRPADCKSVTQKHRRFEVSIPLRSAQDKRPLDVLRPAPSTFRLRVRAIYGATLLKWCAATHRRFKSFRKRFYLKIYHS